MDRRLTVWVAGPRNGELTLGADGEPLSARREEDIDGGTRFTVVVPAGTHTLQLGAARGPPAWSLRVDEHASRDEIDRLLALGRGGHYEQALASLQALRLKASPADRGPTDAAIGRMSLALGDIERAEPAFRASIAAATVEGRIADVIQDGSALVWALVMLQQRFAEARALLAQMQPFAAQYPEGSIWLDYHLGLLAAHTGDVRTALEKYRATERKGRRLQQTTLTENASMEVAIQLTNVGRAEEAVPLLRALSLPPDPCTRAARILNLGWALTERAAHLHAGQRDAEVSEALLQAEAATASCPDPHRRLLAIINGAEYAFGVGDDAEVARLIRGLGPTPPKGGGLLPSWYLDVMGRWFLRKGQPGRALTAFQDQVRTARGSGLLEETFRGEVGVGRALLALGRGGEAIARLRLAQTLLAGMLRGIPLAEGRGSFLGGHDVAVRTLVGALVDGRAIEEAMWVARWARAAELAYAARIDRLAHLPADVRARWDEAIGRYQRFRSEIERQAADDWKAPRSRLAELRLDRQLRADQARSALDDAYRLLIDHAGAEQVRLSAPGKDEAFLTFFPGPRAWYVFAAIPHQVVVRSVDEEAFASPSGAARVLALFRRQLASARRVRLFPYGLADRVSWHAVIWDGRPLLASHEVEYGLDVPSRSGPVALGDQPATARTALIVANPTRDLPAAVPEAEAVARALTGWRVTRLEGAAASREAMLAALSHVRLFHYAGHAEVAGPQGLSSALVLNGGARVELGDLLAVPSVPDLVILSACEAAGTAILDPSLMGLAQAFVAAGARAAIAPTRPIGDRAARTFAEKFYAALVVPRNDQAASIESAFRTAVLGVSEVQVSTAAEGTPKAAEGWESFRLLVP